MRKGHHEEADEALRLGLDPDDPNAVHLLADWTYRIGALPPAGVAILVKAAAHGNQSAALALASHDWSVPNAVPFEGLLRSAAEKRPRVPGGGVCRVLAYDGRLAKSEDVLRRQRTQTGIKEKRHWPAS